jgi:hypothetical protein
MEIDNVEMVFRARMRALAHRGGAVTKRRHGTDPGYYRNIGRLGGHASVAARKARITAELEGVKPGEAPIVEPFTSCDDVASPVIAHPPMTLSQVLADLESSGPQLPDASNRRKSPADVQAERDFARGDARISEADADDLEPWDPWR